MDIDAILAGARLPEDVEPVCLRGDLLADINSAERRLAELGDSDRHATARRALAEAIEALREQMSAATVEVRMRALPRPRWLELVEGHPPRDGEDGDKILGFNPVSLPAALVRASIVSPELTDDQWVKFEGALTDNQWVALSNMAWRLNRKDVTVPFSFAASQILQSSEPA